MTHSLPPARRNAKEQAELDAALMGHIGNVAFNQLLGLDIDSVRHPSPKIRFEMRPQLIGTRAYGRLHGGVIATALDDVGGLALMIAIGEKHCDETAAQVLHRFTRMGTIDLRIDYLNPGIGTHFIASAEVTRLGARIGSTLMRLVNDQGRLIATGVATYILS